LEKGLPERRGDHVVFQRRKNFRKEGRMKNAFGRGRNFLLTGKGNLMVRKGPAEKRPSNKKFWKTWKGRISQCSPSDRIAVERRGKSAGKESRRSGKKLRKDEPGQEHWRKAHQSGNKGDPEKKKKGIRTSRSSYWKTQGWEKRKRTRPSKVACAREGSEGIAVRFLQKRCGKGRASNNLRKKEDAARETGVFCTQKKRDS